MSSTYKSDSADSAISDLHAWRRELSDQFGGDLHAIVEDAMRRQGQSGQRVIIRRRDLKTMATPPNGGMVSSTGEAATASG